MSKDPSKIIDWYKEFAPDSQQRNNWYAPVAETYDRRQEFLSKLKARLTPQGDRLQLSYISAFHVVFKV